MPKSLGKRSRSGEAKGPQAPKCPHGKSNRGYYCRCPGRGCASTGGGEASARSAEEEHLRAREAAKQVQGVRGLWHLRAREAAKRVQGVRRREHLRAREAAKPVQGVRGLSDLRAREAAKPLQGVRGLSDLQAREGGEAGARSALALPASTLATPSPQSHLRSRSRRSSSTSRTRARRTIRCNDILESKPARHPFLHRYATPTPFARVASRSIANHHAMSARASGGASYSASHTTLRASAEDTIFPSAFRAAPPRRPPPVPPLFFSPSFLPRRARVPGCS